MSETFNFNLGNRSLTAEELSVVEKAKRQFRESLVRHHGGGHVVEGNAVFKATASVEATASVNRSRGADVAGRQANPNTGASTGGSGNSDSWSTKKVSPSNRRY